MFAGHSLENSDVVMGVNFVVKKLTPHAESVGAFLPSNVWGLLWLAVSNDCQQN